MVLLAFVLDDRWLRLYDVTVTSSFDAESSSGMQPPPIVHFRESERVQCRVVGQLVRCYSHSAMGQSVYSGGGA